MQLTEGVTFGDGGDSGKVGKVDKVGSWPSMFVSSWGDNRSGCLLHMYYTTTILYYNSTYKVHDARLLLWLRVRWYKHLIFLGVAL